MFKSITNITLISLIILTTIGMSIAPVEAKGLPPKLVSTITIVSGTRAIEAIAKATHRTVAQVEAEFKRVSETFRKQKASGGIRPFDFLSTSRTLSCYAPNTAAVYFYVGTGAVTLSFSGSFALSNGTVLSALNSFWNCIYSTCVLFGYANLAGSDYTTGFSIYNYVNNINITAYNCGGGIA